MDALSTPVQFNDEERNALLSIKGIGSIVISRLEDLGIDSLKDLADRTTGDICEAVAATLGSHCWKNSPQSRNAISAAIAYAKAQTDRSPHQD
jgi:nucleotidyltransferase/DNA polymerase involved in DNA repair